MNSRIFMKFDFEDNRDDNFRIDRLKNNILRMKLLAKLFIVYELWFGAVNAFATLYDSSRLYRYGEYLNVYLSLVFVNLIFLAVFNRNYTVYIKNMETVSKYESVIMLYICIVMVWGSFVSLMDQDQYGNLMVFMISMMCCSVLCLLDAKKRLIPLVLSSATLFALLPIFQTDKNVVTSLYFNLLIFIPISYVASTVVYKGYCSNYKSNEMLKKSKTLLESETARNRVINNQLSDANRMLKKLLTVDELTGISNRRGFNNFIEISLENKQSEKFTVSVIMIDVDFFKAFNDGYGHTKGDEILAVIAKETGSVANNPYDFAARYGGEEFIYISFGSDGNEILKTAEVIRKKVNDLKIPHEFSTVSKFVTISLGGYSTVAKNKQDIERCLVKADKALYKAKENGRNCFYYYNG